MRTAPPTAARSTTRTPTWGAGPGRGADRRGVEGGRGKAAGVETLDLLDAFQGHEFCSRTAAQNTPFSRPPAAGAEWGRFLGASTVQQGELQEAFHPNAYGQRAIGTCVTRAFAATPGAFSCSGAAGLAPGALTVARQATFARPRITQLPGRPLAGRPQVDRPLRPRRDPARLAGVAAAGLDLGPQPDQRGATATA